MDEKFFWAFLILALIIGAAIGISYTNLKITGRAVSDTSTMSQANPWWNPFSKATTTVFSDTDNGVQISTQGTCTGNNGQFSDVCIDNTILREYYIAGGNCLSVDYDCQALGFDSCSNGACVNVANVVNEQTVTVTIPVGFKYYGTLTIEALNEVNFLKEKHGMAETMECLQGRYVMCCWDNGGCQHGCCFKFD